MQVFTVKILLLLNVGVFGLILLLTLLLSAGEKRMVLLGWVCVAFSVSVFVAPLSIIRQVVRTRSVEFMPFSLSFSLTVSAIVWFLYGLLIRDKYVALPNILGFTFGIIQMGLYALYRKAAPSMPAKVVVDDKEASLTDIVKVPEHIVAIAKLSAPDMELKVCDVQTPIECPPTEEAKENNAAEEDQGKFTYKGVNNPEQV